MQMNVSSQIILQHAGKSMGTEEPTFAYKSLNFLMLIIFIAPMNYIPALQPFRLALVFALLSMITYIFSLLRQGRCFTILGAEVKLMLWLVFFAVLSITHSMWPGGSFEVLSDTFIKSIIVFFLIANLLTTENRFRGFYVGTCPFPRHSTRWWGYRTTGQVHSCLVTELKAVFQG